MQYSKEIYQSNPPIAERLLLSYEDIKLCKKRYKRALSNYKELFRQTYFDPDSDQDIDYNILGKKL